MQITRTALICDDDLLVRQLATAALAEGGYHCFSAASEGEALALFEEQAVDVILMDIYLGDSNGIDGVRRLRALPGGTDVPVIFLTGSVEQRDVEACLSDEVSASAYLNKPLVWQTLPTLCDSLLDSGDIQTPAKPDQQVDCLILGLGRVRQMLGSLVISEETRTENGQGNPNFGLMVQLNVAHKALQDVEAGLLQVLPATKID